jgi:hypothetical protein
VLSVWLRVWIILLASESARFRPVLQLFPLDDEYMHTWYGFTNFETPQVAIEKQVPNQIERSKGLGESGSSENDAVYDLLFV